MRIILVGFILLLAAFSVSAEDNIASDVWESAEHHFADNNGTKIHYATLGEGDPVLFDALKELRKRIADERNVPAYLVFNDATLHAMAAERPTSEAALLSISGVGPKKLETYGEAFLEALRDHPDDPA